METSGNCKEPTRVVVPIQDYTTAADKEYYPHCTILYKCRPDSGCCKDASSECSVKTSEKIKRSFFVSILWENKTNPLYRRSYLL